MIIGNVIGGIVKTPQTMILRDNNGNVFTAVATDELLNVTATADDVRKDSVAITKEGLTVGTKVIPAYHTTEGYRLITSGSKMLIPNTKPDIDSYDYTKLQAIVCLYNSSFNDSVASEKVAIDNYVYDVRSSESSSTIVKNHNDKNIDFGIVNDTDTHWLIRFFMYKEIK